MVLLEHEDSRGARSYSSWTEATWAGLVAVRIDGVDTVQLGLVVACSDLCPSSPPGSSPWQTRIQESRCRSLDSLLVVAHHGYTEDEGPEKNQPVQLDNHSMALAVLLVAKETMDHLELLVGEGAMRMLACLRCLEGIQELCLACGRASLSTTELVYPVQSARQYVIRGTWTGMRGWMATAPSPVLAVAVTKVNSKQRKNQR